LLTTIPNTLLPEAMAALWRAAFGHSLQIVIVDNASKDSSVGKQLPRI
jgi:hypothetical protein